MFDLEAFESRQLLSAVLNNGILTIHGTANNDVIELWNSGVNPSHLIVSENGTESSFARFGLKLVRIYGGKGDDTIRALTVAGPVGIRLSINAGAGNDQVDGGAGNDTIIGNTGNDTISGGAGNDFVDYRYVYIPGQWNGASVVDGVSVNLATGTATEVGGYTDSLATDFEGVIGTDYNDTLIGGNANDTLLGMSRADTIDGGAGDDFLDGSGGGDRLFGGPGNDTLFGDGGNDRLVGGAGSNDLNGGENTDTADYSYDDTLTSGITATIGGTATGKGIGFDTIASDMEEIVGTKHADSLTGDSQANILIGNGGNDTIFGAGGNDQLTGGAGADSFHASEQHLVTDFQPGIDVLA